eukprot:679344-Karenia_brevis.AAC.1
MEAELSQNSLLRVPQETNPQPKRGGPASFNRSCKTAVFEYGCEALTCKLRNVASPRCRRKCFIKLPVKSLIWYRTQSASTFHFELVLGDRLRRPKKSEGSWWGCADVQIPKSDQKPDECNKMPCAPSSARMMIPGVHRSKSAKTSLYQ